MAHPILNKELLKIIASCEKLIKSSLNRAMRAQNQSDQATDQKNREFYAKRAAYYLALSKEFADRAKEARAKISSP